MKPSKSMGGILAEISMKRVKLQLYRERSWGYSLTLSWGRSRSSSKIDECSKIFCLHFCWYMWWTSEARVEDRKFSSHGWNSSESKFQIWWLEVSSHSPFCVWADFVGSLLLLLLLRPTTWRIMRIMQVLLHEIEWNLKSCAFEKKSTWYSTCS